MKLPEGKWKHIRRSTSWERINDNKAAGRVGTFSQTPTHVLWTTLDGKLILSIEAKELVKKPTTVYIRHRSGLEYWFTKEGK